MEITPEVVSDLMILVMIIFLNYLIARLSQPMSEALGQRPWYLTMYVVAVAVGLLGILGISELIEPEWTLGIALFLNLVSIVVAIKYWYWLPAECFRASRGVKVQ